MVVGKDATIERLLADLTEPQWQAVTHTDGALLILAGPGSGKTRVVTRRAAHLAYTVASSHEILAITFTNKAAREMQHRIDALGVAEGMTVSTFHALCARLLRIHHEPAGIARNFSIFDRDDRRKVIKQAISTCGLSTDNFQPAAIDQAIGLAKNELLSPADYDERAGGWFERSISRVYTVYESLRIGMQALDFDDLLMYTAVLLANNAEVRNLLNERFRYVLIDEYQDTNAAQYAIARLLTQGHGNICATGDPDQSIYGWRGADVSNILSFERDYPDATIVRLEQNYRSTGRILRVADALIAQNPSRKQKTLWTDNDSGPMVRGWELETGDDEARMIAADIATRLAEGADAGDMAVFYRVNSLSRAVEEALIRKGIAYQVARGVEFYNRKEIKDVVCYLRAIVNPADDVALLRVINTPPRGIGAATVDRITSMARDAGRSISEVLRDATMVSELGRSAAKVARFAELLADLAGALELPAPQALSYVISQTGLRALYGAEGMDDEGPGANLDELINAATGFQNEHGDGTVLDWLEFTALLSDVDGVRDGDSAVTLMTLHAAKGLEFEVVYMLGLEDGLLPFRREENGTVDEEEERRLCFVGMTRAKRWLTLSRARYRIRHGAARRTVRSPFLDELPRDELEWVEERSSAGTPREQERGGRLPDDIEQWMNGTLVEHPKHGLGRIVSMYRSARDITADVQFKAGPRKTFIIGFSDLKRVDVYDID